jgi:hypothetical protein
MITRLVSRIVKLPKFSVFIPGPFLCNHVPKVHEAVLAHYDIAAIIRVERRLNEGTRAYSS